MTEDELIERAIQKLKDQCEKVMKEQEIKRKTVLSFADEITKVFGKKPTIRQHLKNGEIIIWDYSVQ